MINIGDRVEFDSNVVKVGDNGIEFGRNTVTGTVIKIYRYQVAVQDANDTNRVWHVSAGLLRRV